MKRIKRKRFKKQKDLLTHWLRNIVNRKPAPVVKRKPEKPSEINWKRFWMSRRFQDEG